MGTNETREWSAYQTAIFNNVREGKGHTVVLARAGSGKTTCIMQALEYVPTGCSVLMVAFNKSIATELQQRAPKHVEVSTLHSYGLRTVTKAFGKVRFNGDRTDQFARDIYGQERGTWEIRRTLAKVVSLTKATLSTTPEQVDEIIDAFDVEIPPGYPRDQFVANVLKVIELSKVVNGEIDFDDMIWLPVALDLRTWRYDRVFIDETQDLNAAQLALAKRAVKPQGRICAVGDDRQATYGFRGADKDAVSRIIADLNAKVMPLSITYRCGSAIVDVAREIVKDYEAAPNAPKGIVRSAGESEMTKNARPGDFILSRANAPLVSLCLAFLREGRKAAIQGRDIGKQLTEFVKRADKATVPAFLDYIDEWSKGEIARLMKKNPPAESQASTIEDRAETLRAMAEGAQSVNEVVARIESLFSDVDDENRIVLSTTHKAKGLERDRVWLLAGTYRSRPGVEEDNLWYVAVTRARSELVMVHRAKDKAPKGYKGADLREMTTVTDAEVDLCENDGCEKRATQTVKVVDRAMHLCDGCSPR
ncbi:MAG: hypothetical protein PVSMB8_03750 [Vulcanimicrobiaceae bacterium]